ncbi:O-antigen ligase family protein [Planctomicrobium sp. SH661]|uniref:O-antigen ligase family protein n=1 Tax=Planctomicrobium sp. SH661 TaxID=3448124 RepID=UPI003F5B38EE
MKSPLAGISVASALVIGLLLCRWLVPAEGVEQGHTLWIAAGWLALGTAGLWALWRTGSGLSQRLGIIDVGVAGLVAGHGISALLVLAGTGDQRAALNCFWEWISVGVTWVVLKEFMQRTDFRVLLSWCLLTTVIALAGLGIWQHFVWYPQQGRDMTRLLAIQGQLDSGGTLSADDRTEFRKLQSQFGTDYLMLDEGARRSLLARTRDSLEPIGRFALANSFAALLLIGWFSGLDFLLQLLRFRKQDEESASSDADVPIWRSNSFPLATGITLAIGVISGCLLLTKSRTAVVGVVVALVWLGGRLLVRPGTQRKKILLGGAGLLAVFVVFAVVLSLTGGLDWEILSEAPKSLAFRQEYWRSTWGLIVNHPWFGVGPGNFRQHYFQYKLPGASEEILDPHNLVLDVWANGGILALGGLTILLGVWGYRLIRAPLNFEAPTSAGQDILKAGGVVGAFAFGLTLAQEWLLEGFFDWNLFWIAVGWLAIHVTFAVLKFLQGRSLKTGAVSDWVLSLPAALTAGTAVLVHLLGAGGIGMPAILQLILILFLFSTPVGQGVSRTSRGIAVSMGAGVLLFLGCLWTGLVPVATVGRLLEQGRYESLVEHRMNLAEKTYAEAVAADRLASAPHDELAALAFERWMRSGKSHAELFDTAIREKELAIRLNPRAAKEYLTLSDWWLQKYRQDQSPASAEAAISAAEKAVQLYPNFSRAHSQLALAMDAGQKRDEAVRAARRALELDDLNTSRGHVDKLLPKTVREAIERLLHGAEAGTTEKQ